MYFVANCAKLQSSHRPSKAHSNYQPSRVSRSECENEDFKVGQFQIPILGFGSGVVSAQPDFQGAPNLPPANPNALGIYEQTPFCE